MINVDVQLEETLDVLSMVHDLKEQGLVIGVDFDFEFMPVEVDPKTYVTLKDKHVKFTFHNELWASWFILKWV